MVQRKFKPLPVGDRGLRKMMLFVNNNQLLIMLCLSKMHHIIPDVTW